MRASRLKEDAKSGLNQYEKEISDEKRIDCVQQLKDLADKYRVPEKFLDEVESIENDIRAGIRHPSERKFATKVNAKAKEEAKEEHGEEAKEEVNEEPATVEMSFQKRVKLKK